MAPTTWDTRRFQMNVDIKKNGLDYELLEKTDGTEFYPGCRITGKFYARLSPSDLNATLREVEELMPFFPIPVTLNGKAINVVPADAKWDMETPDAYIKMKGSGGVKVYNFGAYVQTYGEYALGCSAIVVTKKHLTLNMARNAILEAECPLWRGIKKHLRELSGKNIRAATKRLTVGERHFLAEQFVSGELDIEDIRDMSLIQDVAGKWHKVSKLCQSSIPVTAAPLKTDRRAEKVHTNRVAFVLHARTLEMFSCKSVEELVNQKLGFTHTKCGNLDDFMGLVAGDFMTLSPSDLRADDRLSLRALQKAADAVANVRGWSGESTQTRNVRPGMSEIAEAWTDGSTYIVLNESIISGCRSGLSGFIHAVNVLAHEYTHDVADTGSHEHDSEFYESFHELVLSPHFARIATDVYRWFVKRAIKEGVQLNSTTIAEADMEAKQDNHVSEKGDRGTESVFAAQANAA